MAGACGINEVKILHREDGRFKVSTVISGLGKGCFSVDSSWTQPEYVFTTAKEGMFIYSETKSI